jgi:transglutaminase-like putative cysteine protease
MEPSNARWLFALEIPQALPGLPGHLVSVSGELEIESDAPVTERIRYDLASYTHFSLQAADRLENPAQWLLLPYGSNPRALAAGEALRREPDPVKRVATVLRQFATGGFVYTLQPPLLGDDSVDEFLYDTRAGFCEHYAGAFVFLMRAAGVPARVVTGYQGGELNPVDGYLIVRQSDAHAWAEVWLPGRGWVRIDPTSMAAPDRLRRSAASLLPPPAPFGIPGLGRLLQPSPDSLLAKLRFAIGAANNGWNQWVLNYTPERQRGLVERLERSLLHWQSVALVLATVLLLLAGRKFARRRRADPVDALYSALCQRLGQLGLPRAPDEGPTAYAGRVANAGLSLDTSTAAGEFLRRYSAHRYGPRATGPVSALLPTLNNLLSRVR